MRIKIKYYSVVCSAIAGVCAMLLIASCGTTPTNPVVGEDCVISDFSPMINFDSAKTAGGIIPVYVDYTDALGGIVLPSPLQNPGMFAYSFKIKNTGTAPQKYRYRLFYQNESYKFEEILNNDSSMQHPMASENFYGSWEQTEGIRTTHPIPADGAFHAVVGTWNIQGNPRNETRYMHGTVNQRWKRNPRMGKYSCLLIVRAEASDPLEFPQWCDDLSLMQDSSFINPYYYFLYGKGKASSKVSVVTSSDTINVISRLPLDAGVYIEPYDFSAEQHSAHFNAYCGQSPKLQQRAVFRQFLHFIDSSSSFNNIPVVADVEGNAYSLTDYNWNRAFTTAEERIYTLPSVTQCPCDELPVDTVKRSIQLINPAADFGNWRKQNVGIISRFGLTYGTYTVKVKMPELLNEQGIWNGLTNAIWLITQSVEPWNNRRSCNDQGYITQYYNKDNQRSHISSYSEIDFEILKTGPYCPEYRYYAEPMHPIPDRSRRNYWDLPYPGETDQSKDEIMVCCTNWDMACPEPEYFQAGCQDLQYKGSAYTSHRWDDWYKAITSKTTVSDDDLFGGDYYYFQIVWKPEEIIWRIGPERDKLRVVGYMNAGMTSIPNNQMSLIVSQEFHDTSWWPGSPFAQWDIPFPAKPLIGEVLEVTIE